jgi:hypothetical protein
MEEKIKYTTEARNFSAGDARQLSDDAKRGYENRKKREIDAVLPEAFKNVSLDIEFAADNGETRSLFTFGRFLPPELVLTENLKEYLKDIILGTFSEELHFIVSFPDSDALKLREHPVEISW